jgi:hypothetical protein
MPKAQNGMNSAPGRPYRTAVNISAITVMITIINGVVLITVLIWLARNLPANSDSELSPSFLAIDGKYLPKKLKFTIVSAP